MLLESHSLAVSPGENNTLKFLSLRNPSLFLVLSAPGLQIFTPQGEKTFQGTINPKAAGATSGKNSGHIHMALLQNEFVNFEMEISSRAHYAGALLKLHITNLSLDPLQIGKISFGEAAALQSAVEHSGSIDWGAYQNGWQSWSYTASYSAGQKPLLSRLKPFQGPKLYDAASPQTNRAGVFASDQFGVLLDRTNRVGLLAGFLSQQNHFGHVVLKPGKPDAISIQAAGDRAVLTTGRTISTDWLVVEFLDLNDPDPLKGYLQEVGRENKVRISNHIPSGWCSWYHYFTGITPDVIRMNLDVLTARRDELPLDCVQIDDGYESVVGDWLDTKHRFFAQMDVLAEEIKEQGYKPGLWIAPFIVHPGSRIYKEHPEWLIRDEKGKVVNAGWNWNRFCAGLDLTHPEVQIYIRQVIENAVREWGYTYLKLDFLYAGALQGVRHDPNLTRAQALRRGMEIIRDAAGKDTYILGCGAPLGPMLGLVDGMRIGTDVAPDWEPKYNGIELLFPNEPDIPSVKNAMHNAITRAMMHQRWWQNDPDCLLLRESSNLSLAEVQTMASIIGMTGGLMLISDEMDKVFSYRRRIAQALLPIMGLRAVVIDWADAEHPCMMRLDLQNASGNWHLLSYTNWSNRPVKKTLCLEEFKLSPESNWYLRSFWTEKGIDISQGEFTFTVLPHGTQLISARAVSPDLPAYLGSNLHISQGLELSRFDVDKSSLAIQVSRPLRMDGIIDLYLPGEPRNVLCMGQPVKTEQMDENIYRLDVAGEPEQSIQIEW